MTDKQIIIDGVDVSGCKYFRKDDPCKNTCHYFCTPCECVEIQNCMYKYAKRKEQECEANEDLVNEYFNKIMILEDRNFRLKKALTEIKEIAMGIMDDDSEESSAYYDAKRILQKCEVINE